MATEVPAFDDGESLPDETAGAFRDAGRFQGGGDGLAPAKFAQEAVDGSGVRPAAGHRPVV